MAVHCNNGAINLGSAIVTAEPLTLGIDFNLDFGSTPETLIGVFSTTGGTSYFQIETNGSNKVFADKNSVFNGQTTVTSSNSYTPGSWSRALATFNNNATKDVNIYLDGIAGTPAAANFSFAHTLVDTYISGRWFAGSYERPVLGCLARGVGWSAVLDSGEISAFMSGVDPRRIRPASLALLAPLQSTANVNVNRAGTGNLTASNIDANCNDSPAAPIILCPRGFQIGHHVNPVRRTPAWAQIIGA